MAFIIPWIFRAGTKAKSAEVNENFLAVKQFVDLLEEDVAANQIMVQTLDDTKANVNGNPTERFQVATAIVGNDAVNLNTLEKNTQNARGYIDGYRLSATTRVVTASRGSCYSDKQNDGEYEYLIKSDTSIQTETLTLGANAKYYIFVCGSEDGTVYPELSVTVNSTTPPLPEGTDCWRRIGWLNTNEDGNIEDIYNEGDQVIPESTGFIGSMLINRETTVAYGTVTKTAPEDIWVYFTQAYYNSQGDQGYYGAAYWVQMEVEVGNTWLPVGIVGRASHVHQYPSSIFIPVKKGQRYRFVGDGSGVFSTYRMVR